MFGLSGTPWKPAVAKLPKAMLFAAPARIVAAICVVMPDGPLISMVVGPTVPPSRHVVDTNPCALETALVGDTLPDRGTKPTVTFGTTLPFASSTRTTSGNVVPN